MAQELSLKDRLQPALLDRLTDDERLLTIFRIVPDPARLQKLGLTEDSVDRTLTASGFRRIGSASQDRRGTGNAIDYVATRPGTTSPRSLRLRSAPGAPESTLTDCCAVEVVTATNMQLETPDRRAISMRKLREAVLRDLAWLLNASGIDDVVELERFPEVRRSVLNYGLKSQAGRAISSLDPIEVARRIRDSIMFFEPRLSEVRVVPEDAKRDSDGMLLSFLVEAELWGQPLAQHLSLRTSIDVDSGNVDVVDRAARP